MFGDSPTVEDAVLFAFTTQIVYHDSGPLNEYISSNDLLSVFNKQFILMFILTLAECPNLMRHMNTIKEEYWPDWSQRVKEVL